MYAEFISANGSAGNAGLIMALGPRLELRQGQALVMTPQLQQAIKLLQLSNIELLAYVEQELERNPLLERTDSEAVGVDDGSDPFDSPEIPADPAQRLELGSDAAADTARAAMDADGDSTFTDRKSTRLNSSH